MKTVFALIIASFAMIVFGIVLIVNSPSEPEQEAGPSDKTESAAPSQKQPQKDIAIIPAPAEKNSEIPELEVDAEPGSESWCEQMMTRPNAEWSREQSQTFADHCLYED